MVEIMGQKCPKCGIIYEKYFAYIEKKKKMAAEKSAPQKEHHPTDSKLISELLDFVIDFTDIPDIAD
jgi:hypothetical protein